MEKTALLDQIKIVAGAREKVKALSDQKKALYDDFQTEHAGFFACVATATSITEEAEAKLRKLTIEVYNATGDKHPAPGLGIRELTKLAYDEKEALKWAKSHDLYLKLDDKKFKDYAKDGEIDFVTITTEVTATIATKLEVNALGVDNVISN